MFSLTNQLIIYKLIIRVTKRIMDHRGLNTYLVKNIKGKYYILIKGYILYYKIYS